MRKILAFVVAAALAAIIWPTMVALWLARGAAFVVLLFLRPFVSWVFGFGAFVGLIGLALGYMIAGDRHHMLWTFFGIGVVSTLVLACYDAIVLTLAPGRFPLLLVR